MLFPETDRVIYSSNPLEEVICQLRFPPILQIEKGIPYDFQEGIRSLFPEFVEGEEVQVSIPGQGLGVIPGELRELANNTIKRKNFSFLSEDKQWKINLSRNFIALSTVNYTRWELFQEKTKPVIDCLVDIYKPAFFSRIGLRYRDIIQRSKLGLTDSNWSELLQPSLICFLGEAQYQNFVDEYVSNTILEINEMSKVRIQTGFVNFINSLEKGFVIDSDFFTIQNTEIPSVYTNLNHLHECSSRLIRWCFTEKLHNALGPNKI